MKNDLVNLSLVTLSCVYSAWLREHKHAEPDHIWAEVTIGVAYTLIGARLKRRAAGAGPPLARWLSRDAHIYAAFAYASLPIIIGELAQWRERAKERERLAKRWEV